MIFFTKKIINSLKIIQDPISFMQKLNNILINLKDKENKKARLAKIIIKIIISLLEYNIDNINYYLHNTKEKEKIITKKINKNKLLYLRNSNNFRQFLTAYKEITICKNNDY